jgi:hypothetical protein
MFAVTAKFDQSKCPGGLMLPSKIVVVSVSIDTKFPDRSGITVFSGEAAQMFSDWLAIQHGMYGKRLADRPTPIDLVSILKRTNWLEHRVVLGAEVLKLSLTPAQSGSLP